ncbi:MAG: prepilin-type N-terminal cleavage/methylation domain-containing protein [Gemmatimonadota bacterium]
MKSRSAGFTLVEMLVALTVAGIALAAGFGALTSLQDRSTHARDATTAALESAASRDLIVNWLVGARRGDSDLGEVFEGRDAAELSLVSDELYFPTTARTPLDTPTTLVRLYLDFDPNTPERGLVAELVGRQADEPVRMELAPQVLGMEIRYRPDVDGQVEWAASWMAQDALPRAVEIVLFDDPADPMPPLLALPIRVALATLQ